MFTSLVGRAAVALYAIFAVLIPAACAPETSPVTVMIGDSLGFSLVLDHIESAAVGMGGIANTAPGRMMFDNLASTTDSGINAWNQVQGHTGPGSWVIIELGTNDSKMLPYEDWNHQISTFLGSIPENRCVGWVGTYRQFDEALSSFWNATVRSWLESRHGCHAFLDWDWYNRINNATGGPDLLGPDGVHLTSQGKLVYADLIHRMWTTGADVS